MGTYSYCYREKEGAYAATSESNSFPNLDFEIERYLGPGEIVRMQADRLEQLRKPDDKMQICSFCGCITVFPIHVMKAGM